MGTIFYILGTLATLGWAATICAAYFDFKLKKLCAGFDKKEKLQQVKFNSDFILNVFVPININDKNIQFETKKRLLKLLNGLKISIYLMILITGAIIASMTWYALTK